MTSQHNNSSHHAYQPPTALVRYDAAERRLVEAVARAEDMAEVALTPAAAADADLVAAVAAMQRETLDELDAAYAAFTHASALFDAYAASN